MDESVLRARLDECLLDETIASEDIGQWAGRPNPFPALEMIEEAGV